MGAIGAQLLEVGWQANDDQSQVVHLAAAFADSSEWALAGYSSASRWIAEQLDVAHRTANEWIRVGRCLRDLPAISSALDRRRISFSKARELTRSARSDNELALLNLAETVPANQLGQAIASWLQGHESEDVIDARQHRSRSLRWQTEHDGMVTFTARLAPGSAGQVASMVDAQAMGSSQRKRGDADDWPSLAQQRADAFMEVLSSGGSGVVAELVIHVRGKSEGLVLDDGTPITSTSVAGLVSEGFVRALIHDAERRPINASSRQRHPTVRQRRVVKERDRVCVDCGSSEFLQFDHVPDFAESRHTVVEELELRCSTCHHFRHSQSGE